MDAEKVKPNVYYQKGIQPGFQVDSWLIQLGK